METTDTLLSAGLRIFYRAWRPAETTRGAVVIVPGFNSHSGYYRWVAERLVAQQLAVYAIDLRGRGNSDGERFFVERFDDYVADVHALVSLVRSREASIPVFLLGHSAGGVVACLYALEHQDDLAGLICESFAFRLPAPDFALAVFKGIAHLAPHAHVLHLKNVDFSRDQAAVEAMDADPLIAHETQPTQTLAAMVRADETLDDSFGRIRLPLLILHGTKDKATRPDGSRQFLNASTAQDKTLKLYEGGFHDLLNDTDKEIVLGDISRWIAERLPGS